MPGLLGVIADGIGDEKLLDRMISAVAREPWHKVDRYVNPPFHVARVHLGKFNPEPQPIFNEDGTLCVFMHGKIYGCEDEKKRLEGRHRFGSGSDAELCLHLYEETGPDAFRKLNGTFVLLICDLREKKAILANDRNALRNLYYAEHDGALLFAPRARAILEAPGFKREVDVEAMATDLAFGEFWGDRTLFRGIRFLPQASMLTCGREGVSTSQYWHFQYQPDYSRSDEALAEEVAEALRKAVAVRMKGELRYGLSLSGGLDSRAVLAAMEPEDRRRVATFTYGPLHCGEVKTAEKVARECGTAHRCIEITPRLIVQQAAEGVRVSEGRMSIWLSYMHPVYRLVRDDVDVVLDGFEFDPFLGGTFLKKHRIRGQSREQLYIDYQRDRTVFRDDELLRLFLPGRRRAAAEAPRHAFETQYARISNDDPRLVFDEFFWRTRAAYLTGSHVWALESVEMSCPTVDNDLLSVVFRIPPEKRLGHYIYRLFLKRLSPELARIPYNKTMVPASWPLPLWRAGKAFRFGRETLKHSLYRASRGRIYIPNSYRYIDDAGWLRASRDWREYVRDLLLQPQAASRAYFEPGYVRCLVEEHQTGARDHADKILRLMTFELFLREFMA